MEELRIYIDGAWHGAAGRVTEPVVDPATGQPFADLVHASRSDLDLALGAAERAMPAWRATPASARGAILAKAAALLRERADQIARIMTIEQGKPLQEARLEVGLTADIVAWNGEEATRLYGRIIPARNGALRHMVLNEPIGPVAAFTPWNFPLMMPGRKVSSALAAGCTCIIKASEETPGTAIALAQVMHDAGVPPGVLAFVFGVPAEVSEYLIASPVIRKVSFTGSVPVGRIIGRLCGDQVKPVTLELGGHAPVLIFDDVDPVRAAKMSAATKFRNAGQVCISPTRFYVQEGVHDRFVTEFAEAARKINVGPGIEPGVGMGALANPRRVAAIEGMVNDAKVHGAKVEAGGGRVGNAGFFFQPTVLSDMPDAAQAMSLEPFGPLAVVQSFRSEEEALQRANSLPYGLAAYAFTADADRQVRLADGIESGMVGLNTFHIAAADTPFGGVKDSGHGSEGGVEGLSAFTTTKFVAQASAHPH
ncbi:NAD-dependent succinate-semialdehyde dehydrogenase [Caulobacter sp. S45]|uniref:NAD-dependent succinate-semialdehyde dehydrogenase n=1 Tax=Caulobacter sp. S45 TaxID=1641861 RepID=UPI00131E00B1|nr:NAD-dependent succinate-semialdehyde dehydrogenase [Caulobacter sp. S45]